MNSAKSKYELTAAQVESLARDMTASNEITKGGRTTYLRVIVTAVQSTLGNVKRGKTIATATQLDVLNDVTDRYYAAVLRGITTPDIEHAEGLEQAEATRRSIERNKRSTFARTTKSALKKWVKAGGDIRALDAETVTRDPLTIEVNVRRGVDPAAQAFQKHQRALLRMIEGEAKEDPAAARADIEATMEALQAILDELSPNGNGHSRKRGRAQAEARPH